MSLVVELALLNDALVAIGLVGSARLAIAVGLVVWRWYRRAA